MNKKSLVAGSVAIACLSSIILTGCGSGSTGSSSSTSTGTSVAPTGFSGQAQKGPLIFGSEITIYELDSNLQQTGRSFDAQTTDDLGNFTVAANLATNFVSMVGVGYYMDELTGSLSSAPVTLNAIADLSVDPNPTINVLTTLATPRIKHLIQNGSSYKDAITQAQGEVLAVFGIDAAKINGLEALYAMKINGAGDQDAALLATSSILSQMATNAALAGSSQAAQLSFYLSRIASDIKNTGRLNSSTIRSALAAAASQLNLSAVRNNVQTYYANRGVTFSAPKFEEWVDKNNSGILPQRLVPAAGLTFTDSEVEIGVSTSSNASTISGLGSGITAQVSINGASNASNTPGSGNHNDWKIVRNNVIVSGNYTTVQDGDTLGMQLTSDGFGSTVTTTLSVGSSTATWNVRTRKPQVVYDCQSSSSVPQGATNSYFAIPVLPTVNTTINYVGIGVGAASAPDQVSIYSDRSSEPGVPLITTTNVSPGGYFLGTGYTKIDGNPITTFSYPQAQLASTDQFTVQAGTLYWIVLKYNTPTRPYFNNAGCVNTTNSSRKMSSDGVTWSDWRSAVSGNTDDNNPSLLPGHFMAN